jgi:hypothetical protein
VSAANWVPDDVKPLRFWNFAAWRTGFGFHVEIHPLFQFQFERWTEPYKSQVGGFSKPWLFYWVRDGKGTAGFHWEWLGSLRVWASWA